MGRRGEARGGRGGEGRGDEGRRGRGDGRGGEERGCYFSVFLLIMVIREKLSFVTARSNVG